MKLRRLWIAIIAIILVLFVGYWITVLVTPASSQQLPTLLEKPLPDCGDFKALYKEEQCNE